MKFDAYAVLDELRAEAGGGANRAKRANPTPPFSTISTFSTGLPPKAEIECGHPAPPHPADPPSAPDVSRDAADLFRHGRSVTGAPRTWTGRIVSLDEWRRLTEWERHGSTGKLFCGICRAWIEANNGCPHTDCQRLKGGVSPQ